MTIDDMIDAGTDDMIGVNEPGGRLAEMQFMVYTGVTGSESQQEWLAKLLAYHHDNDLTRAQKLALWDVMKKVFGRLATAYREDPQPHYLAMMEAITEEFELEVRLGDETRYMSAWIPVLRGDYDKYTDPDDLPGLCARLADVPSGSTYQVQALDDLLAYAARPALSATDRTAIEDCLRAVLVRDGKQYMWRPEENRPAGAVLDRICDALPATLVVDLGYGEAPVEVHQGRIRALGVLMRVAYSPIGSAALAKATALLLGAYWCGVDFRCDGTTYAHWAHTLLNKVLYVNAHHPRRSPELREYIRWVFPDWDPDNPFWMQFDH